MYLKQIILHHEFEITYLLHKISLSFGCDTSADSSTAIASSESKDEVSTGGKVLAAKHC